MTPCIPARPLTAVAALLFLQPLALPAQEAATEDPAPGATAADGAATGAATTAGAATEDGADLASGGVATDAATGEAPSGDAGAAQGAAGDVGTAPGDVATGQAATPSPDMQAVLDKLAELGAPPIGTVSVEEQRAAPTPADAVMAVMADRGIEAPAALAAILARDVTYPAADGSQQPARVYTPPTGEGPFPLIVYFHGGGWVIADIDAYDASARALAAGANAVVVSVEYRKGPESPFPAPHDDANAAFTYFVETSGEINADATRLAVAGESAGGNLAVNVAIFARDNALTPIDLVLSVYPIADDSMATPSYQAYADAQPLSKMAMMWFVQNAFEDPAQAADPRVDLVARPDLAGLPPTVIINAEIDPLQSEGEVLAASLAAAGVPVTQMTYPGVTHEFFGMGAVVPQAKEAEDMATEALREAFGAAQ